MGKIINKLKSIKLTIVLLIIIIFLSIIGTFIPQNAEEWKYIELFGYHGYALIKYGQLQNIYHSWWYLGALCLLGLNIISCLTNKIKTRSKDKFDNLTNFKLHQKFSFDEAIEDVEDKIKRMLANFKYKIKSKKEKKFWSLYAEKGKLNRIGYYLVHLGLLLILLGGLMSSLWGYRDYLKITVNEIVSLPKNDFKIRADDFQIKYYPDSSRILSYESKLTVIEKGKEALTKLVKVNHPLKYKGFSFYQNSYGISKLGIKITDKKGKNKCYLVKVGQKINLEKHNLYLKVEHFLPDLIVEGTRIYSKSQELNNPAAKIGIYQEKKGLLKSFWLFYKYPHYHRNPNWNKEDLDFKLVELKPYTELQVVKDKGLYLVYGGFLLLISGIIFSLLIPFRRVQVNIRKGTKDIVVEIAGKSSKEEREMKGEFALITEEIANIK